MEKVEILQNVTISRRLATGETPWMVPGNNTEDYAGEKKYHLQPKKARHHTLKFLSLLLVRKAQKAAKIEREN